MSGPGPKSTISLIQNWERLKAIENAKESCSTCDQKWSLMRLRLFGENVSGTFQPKETIELTLTCFQSEHSSGKNQPTFRLGSRRTGLASISH